MTNIPVEIEQTILDNALNLAKKVLDTILFEEKNLEKNLYGFLAISNRLGRERDIAWVKGELQGFDDDMIMPSYREKVGALISQEKIRLFTKDDLDVFSFH